MRTHDGEWPAGMSTLMGADGRSNLQAESEYINLKCEDDFGSYMYTVQTSHQFIDQPHRQQILPRWRIPKRDIQQIRSIVKSRLERTRGGRVLIPGLWCRFIDVMEAKTERIQKQTRAVMNINPCRYWVWCASGSNCCLLNGFSDIN